MCWDNCNCGVLLVSICLPMAGVESDVGVVRLKTNALSLLFLILKTKWCLLPCLLATSRYMYTCSTFPCTLHMDNQNHTFCQAVPPILSYRSPSAHTTFTHFSQALSRETRPRQNQICTPFLCYKTLHKYNAHSCSRLDNPALPPNKTDR